MILLCCMLDGMINMLTLVHSMSLRAAIGLQIMELIADKKGIDQDLFKSISADLDRMKKEVEGAGGNGSGSGQHRQPPVGERDPKRPRI